MDHQSNRRPQAPRTTPNNSNGAQDLDCVCTIALVSRSTYPAVNDTSLPKSRADGHRPRRFVGSRKGRIERHENLHKCTVSVLVSNHQPLNGELYDSTCVYNDSVFSIVTSCYLLSFHNGFGLSPLGDMVVGFGPSFLNNHDRRRPDWNLILGYCSPETRHLYHLPYFPRMNIDVAYIISRNVPTIHSTPSRDSTGLNPSRPTLPIYIERMGTLRAIGGKLVHRVPLLPGRAAFQRKGLAGHPRVEWAI